MSDVDTPNDTTHEQAIDRFKVGTEAIEKQTKRELSDLAFQVPELQWPEDVRASRAGQIINGVPLPARPMISIPMLDQPVQLVLNQEKAAHLGVQVHPLSADADDDTAELQQGLYRAIERNSRANLARSWAFDRATKCGRGAYRVLTQYCQNTGDAAAKWDQEIVIKRILHQESVVFDPFAQESDWSDGEWAFVTEWIPKARYQRKYGTSKLAKADAQELLEIAETAPGWMRGDGEATAYLVAEYWRVDVSTTTETHPEDAAISRTIDRPSVKWRTMNATEWLTDEQEWNGKYIPLIPVIGRELQPFDAERRWAGIYTNAKDAVRLVNYSASGAVELAALETKAPYTMVEGQQEGHEAEWAQANVRNFPYLLYRNVSLGGAPAPPPQRTQVDTSRLGPSMMLLQMGKDFVHASTGAYEPTLGEDSSRQQSGTKVKALQQQHDAGTSNYLDNLSEISMTLEAKVVLDLISKVYDREGRIAQILDLEDHRETVMLNQPYVMDPQTKRPVAAQPGQPNAKHYDLTKGIYGVSVTVGKSYQTRLDQGSDQMGQLLQAEPALFQILGDIWLKFQDWPGHTEAAERVKKMLPPPLQDQAQQDAAAQAQQLQAENQQLKQAAGEMQKIIEKDAVKAQAQLQIAQGKDQTTLEKARMDNETRIAVAELGAKMERMSLFLEERARLGVQGHETALGAAEAGHQERMAEMAHQQALQAGVQQQQNALEQGEQGQQHALEQGEQAAALAPTSEPGV